MYIRVFVNTNSSDEALQISNQVIHNIRDIIDTQEIVKIEPYWKIEGIYVVEIDIKLKNELKEEQLKSFLEGISDGWIFYGNPMNEALASETKHECNFIMKGVNMINIFF